MVLLNIVLVTGMMVGLAILAAGMRPPRVGDFPAFTVLLVAAAASAGLRFGHGTGRVAFSFTAVVLLAAIPIVGPVGAILLGVGAAILDARQGWWQAWMFNGVMFGLSAAVASLVYGLAGGRFLGYPGFRGALLDPSASPLELTRYVGLPLVLADIAFILTNLAVLLLVTPVDPAIPSRRPLILSALRTVPTFLAWAVVAFVLVALWGPGGLGALAVLLIVAPLVVARHIHGLFSDERRIRSSIIDALARAGRDDGTEAHGERVWGYASAIAGEMGLRPADRSALQYAARLHAVATGGPCSHATTAGDEGHPGVMEALAAERLMSHIGFLGPASTPVLHQTEWFDGTGGPDALAGEDIPLVARVLAVADAADVLVTTSTSASPRQEAVATLRASAGRRFDPAVVEVLATVLEVPPGAAPSLSGVPDEPRRTHASARGHLGPRRGVRP